MENCIASLQLLARLLKHATLVGNMELKQRATLLQERVAEVGQRVASPPLRPTLTGGVPGSSSASGNALAGVLSATARDEAEEIGQNVLMEFGVAEAFGKGPRAAIRALANAGDLGLDVVSVLDRANEIQKVESVRKSLAQVASALRAWHAFACGLLLYEDDRSLPPRSDTDAERFLAIHKNARTGCNYLSSIEFACVLKKLSTDWVTPSLKLAKTGARKLTIRRLGNALSVEVMLNDTLVARMVAMARAIEWVAGPIFILMGYKFLMRMVNECIPLEFGEPDELTELPANRHSAVFVLKSTLFVRLRSRKHRPSGSLLECRCECLNRPAMRDGCVVHTFLEYQKVYKDISGQQNIVGHTLFSVGQVTSSALRRSLVRILTLLEVPAASRFTWKQFRASRATQLARDGVPLADIMKLGEWKSRAVARYLDEEVLDARRVIELVTNESEEENEELCGLLLRCGDGSSVLLRCVAAMGGELAAKGGCGLL